MAALADAQSKTEHERTLRLYSEQSHQETIKQQLLELELKQATDELKQKEQAARQRLFNVSAFAEQSAMVPYHDPHAYPASGLAPPVPPAVPMIAYPIGHPHHVAGHPHHHHHPHHAHGHYYAMKHSHLSLQEIEARRHRRAHHHCSRCRRVGHYSKECRFSPTPGYRRHASPSRLLGSSPRPKGYLTSASAASSAGGYSTDDEEWVETGGLNYDDDEDYEEEDEEGQGVLVYYDGGAAPGSSYPRSSVRHVVGV